MLGIKKNKLNRDKYCAAVPTMLKITPDIVNPFVIEYSFFSIPLLRRIRVKSSIGAYMIIPFRDILSILIFPSI